MSVRLKRFDYAGISIMIAGSCTPPFYLGFFCDELQHLRWAYLGSMWLVCVAAALATFFPDRTNATFRAVIFILAGVSCLPGIIHLTSIDAELLNDFRVKPWLLGGIAYITGAVIYAIAIPERCWKNTFDIFGASHQIFHIAVLVGALMHIRGSLLVYLNRVEYPCPATDL